ncbi:MAG: SufB/SufD family protein [Pseudomonadales bacterium]
MSQQPVTDAARMVAQPVVDGRQWLDQTALRDRARATLASGLTRELWKYTPIKGFIEAVAQADSAARIGLQGIDQPEVRATPLASLTAEQQQRVRQISAEHLNHERHPLADLTLLGASDGWLLEVAGRPEAPIEIDHPGTGLVPVFLLLDANAEVTVIERLHAHGFLAQVLHAELGTGARLHHHRGALERDVAHYSLLSVRLQRDASLQLNQTMLGGKRRRAEVHVVMAAEGAEVNMAGAYLVEQGQHLDQQLVVEHRAGRTTSRQKFHGIGAGKGRSVLNGRIHIHPGAPGSDAALSNRNLALHPDAEMNTKPELEIYTDDVRCAHGATVGQLQLDSLFYLTARGIPEPAARRLLAHGFLRECLHGPLAAAGTSRLLEALP